MLRGKIISTPTSPGRDYCVKVGSVTVDITDDIRAMIASEVTQTCAEYDRMIADLRAKHADIVERYNKIASIVLAGGAGMPIG